MPPVSDAVTALGSGVDGAVRRIETAYDGQGNAYLVTSYDAASSGNVVNQVQRAFNGLGQLVTEYQEHGGAVNTGTSKKVQYAWTEMASGANHSRLTSVTYPSGYVLTHNYASGLNSYISRLTSLSDANGTLESYDHLGFGTVVRRGHAQPNVDLSFIKRSGESNTDAGDQYTGLDRFGRVIDQRWMDATSGTAKDRLGYTYDQMGNRTARTNAVNSSFDETYTYDGLNQLASFARGGSTQSWDYDAVGNWEGVTTNGTTQTRGHNKQNEITSVSGATTPTFDANGNMTGDETGRQFVYDAWNRMVEVKNSGGTSLKTYEFDGLNRRVSETASGTTRALYYSAQWQVLEEAVGGATERRYVWSPVYVDALVLRDRDTNSDGSLDERLYVIQDANFNVVALIDTSGNVVERYTYSPFGVQTVYDASWSVRTGGSAYAFTHGFQGMAFDATSGTNKSRGRTDYSATLGRWVSMDPIRYEAGDVNLYGFVGQNPTGYNDPSGLDRIESGAGGGLYYVDTGPFGTVHSRAYVGQVIKVNGEEFVLRNIDGRGYFVPIAKVNGTTSNWVDTPEDWNAWFKENEAAIQDPSIKNMAMQMGSHQFSSWDEFVKAQKQAAHLANTAVSWNATAGFNVLPSPHAVGWSGGKPTVGTAGPKIDLQGSKYGSQPGAGRPAYTGTMNMAHKNAGKTVGEILKGKKGSIKSANLEKGSPSWGEVESLTWEQIEMRAAADLPGYRTIKKLLGAKRFDK